MQRFLSVGNSSGKMLCFMRKSCRKICLSMWKSHWVASTSLSTLGRDKGRSSLWSERHARWKYRSEKHQSRRQSRKRTHRPLICLVISKKESFKWTADLQWIRSSKNNSVWLPRISRQAKVWIKLLTKCSDSYLPKFQISANLEALDGAHKTAVKAGRTKHLASCRKIFIELFLQKA